METFTSLETTLHLVIYLCNLQKCVIEFHDIPPFLSRLIFKLGLMISGKTVCFAVTNKLSEDLFYNLEK